MVAADQGGVPGRERRGAGERHQRGRADPRATPARWCAPGCGVPASWRRRPPAAAMFAGTPDGGCIWPEFLPAYDAAVTLVKLLDLLAAVDRPLSAVVAALPEIHVAHETIVTPWERKGTVMREIVERAGDARGGAHRRREGRSTTASGRWCCPTPTRRSPTCGPRPAATSTPAAWPRSTSQRIRQVLPVAASRTMPRCSGGVARGRMLAAMVGTAGHGIPRGVALQRGARVGGGRRRPRPHRHHRLRPGLARRRRLRRAARRRRQRDGPRQLRRGGVDQVGVGDLLARHRHRRRGERGARTTRPSR